MDINLRDLGEYFRAAREDRELSQEELASAVQPPTNRTAVALLEQGRRLPPEGALRALAQYLSIPKPAWETLLDPAVARRLEFEDVLTELVGSSVSLRRHDQHAIEVAQHAVLALFGSSRTKTQLHDAFYALLVFYNVQPPQVAFCDHYLRPDAFQSIEAFRGATEVYQRDAIRLFSSFAEAYAKLSSSEDLAQTLEPLRARDTERYRERTPWDVIEEISEERLPDLGYISAARVRKEQAERTQLAGFLDDLAQRMEAQGRTAITEISEKRRRKINSLLRKFDSVLQHDLLSPLFGADPDEIRREARRLAPKEAADLKRMEATQATGQRNLARYLAADHLDVYVATSMRTDADFVSVNSFVHGLFEHDSVRPLKLRFFNPTQSWIEDRVAKGLVEALMLRRADFAIYMAQKEDTFGKDSEASVALGQGKPVIVYVPRLHFPRAQLDSEELGMKDVNELKRIVETEATGEDAEVDDATDHQALLAQALKLRLDAIPSPDLPELVRAHWADFDLYGEASRLVGEKLRADYRAWLDETIVGKKDTEPAPNVREHLIGILVATCTNFEKRAKVFREVHPLALQVILSSGVLNGILVARSVDSCARLLERLARNDLQLALDVDADNYRLVETSTRSTVRVISRHRLITSAFSAFYRRPSRL